MKAHSLKRLPVALFAVAATCTCASLVACDKETSSSKSTTTKVTETPEGTKKTTETTEKKVEVNPK